MVHSHTVHLPLGALLIGCTMCATGGIYLDVDTVALVPFSDHAAVFSRPFLTYQLGWRERPGYQWGGDICNCIFGFGKRSPFLRFALDAARANVLHRATHSALPHRAPSLGALLTLCTVCGAQVEQDGLALGLAADESKDAHETVLAAVRQNGWALQHASQRLKANHEIVLSPGPHTVHTPTAHRALSHASELGRAPSGLRGCTVWPHSCVLLVCVTSV